MHIQSICVCAIKVQKVSFKYLTPDGKSFINTSAIGYEFLYSFGCSNECHKHCKLELIIQFLHF